MKHLTFILILLFSGSAALAATPQLIDYQGYLMESSVAVTGTKNITFTLYDASTGGALLCTSGAQSITVTKGVFTYQIGSSGCALSSINFDNPVYLELNVEGVTLAPREQIAGAAYSVQTRAANVIFSPTGDVAATDVQNAIAELDAIDFVSSIDGVSNDEGDIDLVAGGGISITADDAANTITFAAVAGAVDHNSLSNLAVGDVHTQYFNLSQAETVAAIPAFNGGTTGVDAPFTVDSTYLVSNLNADLLDGMTSTDLVAVAGDEMTGALGLSQGAATATVYAYQTGTGADAGYFEITGGDGNARAVAGYTNGGSFSVGVEGRNTGTGRAGAFSIDNASNSSNTILANHNGTGNLFKGNHTGTGGNLMVLQTGGGDMLVVDRSGNVSASGTINLDTGSASPMVDATQTGAGIGGNFQITGGGAGHALIGNTDGTGNAVQAQNSGSGYVYYGNQAGTGDIIRLDKSGTEQFIVDTNGQVGIGTATPASKLDVEGGAAIGATYSGTSAAPANGLIVEGYLGIGTASPISQLTVDQNTDATAQISIDSGSTAAQASILRFYDRGIDEWGMGKDASNNFYITETSVGYPLVISPGGNVGLGTFSAANVLDVEGSAAIGATYSGASAAPANGLIVQGNVGIGTTSPSAKLEVAGDIRSNNMTCRSGCGTSYDVAGGLGWGGWAAETYCPAYYYVCGLRQRVEADQGSGDDTAVNDIMIICCPF